MSSGTVLISLNMWCSLEGKKRRGDRKKIERNNGRTFSKLWSVQFSCSVMSNSLQPHESQHPRPPCPSPAPRVYPNPCPSSWWCHPTISSSVVPFSSCPQSLPASGSFPMSQLFTWGGKVLEFQLQHQSFQWTPRTINLQIQESQYPKHKSMENYTEAHHILIN